MTNEIAQRSDDRTVLIDDAHIMFRNFSGNPDKFNAQGGKRYFHVLLNPEMAQALEAQGYNVKYLKARDEGDIPQAHLKVMVNIDSNQPPKLHIVTSKGRRQLEPSMLPMLDWADFGRVDLIWNKYERDWPDGRKTVTAYLQTFFGIVKEDELEQRYADVPEIEARQDGVPEIQQDVLVWHESTPEELEELKVLEAMNPPSYDS